MSNEQFSDCGTAYLSYVAHNKSMSYSTKTKLILLVAIMSSGPLSALRRRSVSSAMSYRPLVNSSRRFLTVLSILMSSMLVHGYNAADLLSSTLISIPKNARGDLKLSENNRGIAVVFVS